MLSTAAAYVAVVLSCCCLFWCWQSQFSLLGEGFATVISKEHGGQVDLLFVDTNGVGLPGGMTHLAAIAKYGAGQVDLLFLDSLYKVLEILPISVCIKFKFIVLPLIHPGFVAQVFKGWSFWIPSSDYFSASNMFRKRLTTHIWRSQR
jgi:hypothetical protein